MILPFAFHTATEAPHPVAPILESTISEGNLLWRAADFFGCSRDEIGIETLGDEDASLLIGNAAPAGQVLDLSSLVWNPEEEELTYAYKDEGA
jgi:hypothetical protein